MLLRKGHPNKIYITYLIDRFPGFKKMTLYYMVARRLLDLLSEETVPLSN